MLYIIFCRTCMSETLNQSTRTQKEEDKEETSRAKKKKTPATIRLCNGEIYFIKDVGQIVLHVMINL